jgi:uncharacterized protein
VWEFEWDDHNLEHVEQHGISPDEVEEIFEAAVVLRRGGTDAADRFRALGRTAAGRYLVVIYQQLQAFYMRPITAWDMRPHERQIYDRQVGR